MSTDAAFAVRTWRVGAYTVEMTLQRPEPGAVVNACYAWSPREPARLTMHEWAEYRAGRDHALAGIAAELGINMAVLDR